uniref:Uncharacterized protein n=1 Tax=Glossina brevipalpis TaxID=37001 RepID=A0A1A9W4T6_9MUSC
MVAVDYLGSNSLDAGLGVAGNCFLLLSIGIEGFGVTNTVLLGRGFRLGEGDEARNGLGTFVVGLDFRDGAAVFCFTKSIWLVGRCGLAGAGEERDGCDSFVTGGRYWLSGFAGFETFVFPWLIDFAGSFGTTVVGLCVFLTALNGLPVFFCVGGVYLPVTGVGFFVEVVIALNGVAVVCTLANDAFGGKYS